MTERFEKQEALPGMSEREMLEGFMPQDIVDYILHLGQKSTELENKINMASEVLEGVYGLTVEDILHDRDRRRASLSDVGELNYEQQE